MNDNDDIDIEKAKIKALIPVENPAKGQIELGDALSGKPEQDVEVKDKGRTKRDKPKFCF